jgi:tRNA (adenine57-N1/adenine58-N1)-methyltransferase
VNTPITATGDFKAGDSVQLSDPKGHLHTVILEPGKQFHTHRGALEHDDLIGSPEGCVVSSTNGTQYLALRPLLHDFVLSMPRGATVVYPKDLAAIVGYADVLRAVGPEGSLVSYERRPEFAAVATKNVGRFFGGIPTTWSLREGDLLDAAPAVASGELLVDRAVLDMLAPWEVLDLVASALVPGGVLCVYVATTTQLSRTVEALRETGGWTEPSSWESMVRGWHVDGLAVRPDHRMIGHTGFLLTARRLAPGVIAPPRRRRPAKGARPEDLGEPPTTS